jgi:tetratricopeptide (TPR) repeat protein
LPPTIVARTDLSLKCLVQCNAFVGQVVAPSPSSTRLSTSSALLRESEKARRGVSFAARAGRAVLGMAPWLALCSHASTPDRKCRQLWTMLSCVRPASESGVIFDCVGVPLAVNLSRPRALRILRAGAPARLPARASVQVRSNSARHESKMTSIRATLGSYLLDPKSQNLRESLRDALREWSAGTELADLWRQVREAPARVESVAALMVRQIVDETEISSILDSAQRCGQWAPRDESGDEVALLVAEVFWRLGEQPALAEPYMRRVRRTHPAHPTVLAFYRELFATPNQAAALFQVLVHARRSLSDVEAQFEIAEEAADLAQNALNDRERAIEVWRAFVREYPEHDHAREKIKASYRAAEKWNALVDFLKAELERPATESRRVSMRLDRWLELADLYREKLSLDAMEQMALGRALEIDPEHVEALSRLADSHVRGQRWNELIIVLERLLQGARKRDDRAAQLGVLKRVVDVWLTRVGNPLRAIDPLLEVLRLDPADALARQRLAAIYEQRRDWRALLGLRREGLENASGNSLQERIELARLCEEKLGDRREAISDWNLVLAADPKHGEALAALSRLYQREGQWPHYINVVRRRIASAASVEEAVDLYSELARIYAEKLEQEDAAFLAWAEVLRLAPGHERAMRAMRDVLVKQAKWDEVVALYREQNLAAEVIEVLLAAAERQTQPSLQIELYLRVAEICKNDLAAPERGRAALERILLIDPTYVPAISKLIPIYTEQENWGRVSALHQRQLELAPGKEEKLNELRRLIEIAKEKLNSPTLALQWSEQAYVLEPENESRRESFLNDARSCGGWDVAVKALEGRLAQAGIERTEELVLLHLLAQISKEELAKPEEAQRYLLAIVSHEPTETAALDELERLYETSARWEDVVAMKRRRLAAMEQPNDRLTLLRSIYEIEEQKIQDLARANQTLDEILALAPDDPQARMAQLANAKTRGAWDEVCRTLEIILPTYAEAGKKVGVLLELALIEIHRLHRANAGVEHLLAVLEVVPDHQEAARELEALATAVPEVAVACHRGLLPVYRRRDDKAAQAHSLALLVAHEKDPAERTKLQTVLAKLYESLPGQEREALSIRLDLFLAAPEAWEARQALRRCAELTGGWPEAVAAYSQAIARVSQSLGRVDHEEPATQRSLYALRRDLNLELAALCREKLNRPLDAEQCYREVFDQDESHQGAYEALASLLQQRGADLELLALYRRRVDAVFNPREQRELLGRMVTLAADRLSDLDTAISTAEELLELCPGDGSLIGRLIELYRRRRGTSDASRVDELLGAWAELPAEGNEQIRLLFERSVVRQVELDDVSGALDMLAQIVARDPHHQPAREALVAYLREPRAALRAIQLLEPLYRQAGDHAALVRVLELKHERACADGSLDVAIGALARIAEIEENELGRPERAFVVLRQSIALDPTRTDCLDDLERLAQRIGRFDVLVNEIEQALRRESLSRETRLDLTLRFATILDTKLPDRERARQAMRALVGLHSEDLESMRQALAALIRLEREAQDWLGLVGALEQAQQIATDRQEQINFGVEIAKTLQHEIRDLLAAGDAWRRVLDMVPGHAVALAGIAAVYEASGDFARLAEVIEESIRFANEPRRRAELWRQLAELRQQRLSDPGAAMSAWRRVIELQINRQDIEHALWQLAETAYRSENWATCDDALRRLITVVATDAGKVRVMTRLADLQAGPLDRPIEAFEWLRRAYDQVPTDSDVLFRLRSFVDVEEVAERALELLIPALEAQGDLARLAEAQEVHARRQPSGRRRLAALLAVVDTYENRLDQKERALAVACEALHEAVDQPELDALLGRIEALAQHGEFGATLFAAYEQVAPRILDAQLQRRVYATMGKIALGKLGWIEKARDAYEKAFEGAPDDHDAAAALEWIYTREADYDALATLLARRAERQSKDEDRDLGYLRAAQLLSQELGDHEGAIRLYERLSQESLSRPENQQALEFLYERTGRFRALAAHLNRKIAGQSGSALVELHLRLGRLCGEQLDDPEEGLRHLAAALRLDPNHAVGTDELRRYLNDKSMRSRAASLLEPLFAAVQDWSGLIHIQEIRLEQALNKEQRVAILLKMARLNEEQLEDLEAAFEGYARVFSEDPGNVYVRDQLARLSSVLHQAERYAEILNNYIENQPNDDPQLRQVIQEAASLWRGPARKPAKAVALLTRLRRMRPDDTSVIPELIAAMTEAEMWRELIDLYWHEIEGQRSVQVKIRLLLELARIARHSLKDVEPAVRAYRRILDLQPEHDEARRGLEAALREGRRFAEFVDLLIERASKRSDAEDRAEMLMEVVAVQVEELNDSEAGLDTLETILELCPNHVDALRWLERIAHDHEEARARAFALLRPVYETSGQWFKIMQIVQAQLAGTILASQRQQIYAELARIAEEREQGGLRGAFEWLVRALGEPGDSESLLRLDAEVERVATALERPDAAFQAYVAASDSPALVDDVDRRTELLLRAGQGFIHSDLARAAEVLRRATKLSPANEEALATLDQALERLGAAPELVEVIKHRITLTHDGLAELELVRRLARIHTSMGDDESLRDWQRVLELEASDEEALINLSAIYERTGQVGELIEVLRQRVELASNPATRREINLRLADLLRDSLHDLDGEIERLRAVIAESAEDEYGLMRLSQAFLRGSRFAEAVEILATLARCRSTPQERADTYLVRGAICESELQDIEEAVAACAAALGEVRGHPEAINRLVRLASHPHAGGFVLEAATVHFTACSAWREWIEIARARLAQPDLEPDSMLRLEILQNIADVFEYKVQEAQLALKTACERVDAAQSSMLAAAVEDLMERALRLGALPWALDELTMRVKGNQWGQGNRLIVAHLVAKKSQEALGDLGRTISLLAWLVEAKVADLPTCDEVALLARASSLPAIELRALEEACLLDQASDSEAAGRRAHLGVARLRSGQQKEAVTAFREALELDPGMDLALSGLESILDRAATPSLELVEILETAYAARNDHSGQAKLLRVRLANPGEDHASLLSALGGLLDQTQTTDEEVLDVWGRLLLLDPAHETALTRVVGAGTSARLAQAAGEILEKAVLKASELKIDSTTLATTTARFWLDELREPSRAAKASDFALSLRSDDPEIWALALDVARSIGDQRRLLVALQGLAAVESLRESKVRHLREAATLAQYALQDKGEARKALEALVEIDDSDDLAWNELENLCEKDSIDRADVLARRIALATEHEGRQALRLRRAEVLMHHPEFDSEVCDTLLDLIHHGSLASTELDAIVAQVEPILIRNGRWHDLLEVWRQNVNHGTLAHGTSAQARATCLVRMAELARNELRDFDESIRLIEEASAINATHFEKLDEWLGEARRWDDLALSLENRLEAARKSEAHNVERALTLRLVALISQHLNDPSRALQRAQTWIDEHPEDAEMLIHVVGLHEALGDEAALRETLARVIALKPSGEVGAQLCVKMARFADDAAARRRNLEQAFELAPGLALARNALIEELTVQKSWVELQEVLGKACDHAQDPAVQRDLVLRRVDILSDELHEYEASLSVMATVYSKVTDDLELNRRIADALFAVERYEEALGMYRWVAEVLPQAKRSKQRAHVLARIAGIEMSAGEHEVALARLEEAYHLDPTNLEMLANLGAAYEHAKRWQDGLRIYRAMLLQNVERTGAIRRGDLYLRLASIHMNLGEVAKAKAMLRRGMEDDASHPSLRSALDEIEKGIQVPADSV